MLGWLLNLGFAGGGTAPVVVTVRHRGFTLNVARLLRSSR